jgi:uncharacterized protein YggE
MGTYVEVVGRGSATQQPDRLDLHVGVSAVRPTVGEALTRLGAQVARLGEVVRELGVEDRDIRSTHNSVGEEYVGSERQRAGFRAEQGLVVRIRDISSVTAVVDAAVAAVGDDFRMNGLGWAVSDDAPLAARAREAAFEDAREKATQLATVAGRTVGELRWVRETDQFGGGPVRVASLKQDSSGFAPERGESEVSISVTARWSLA